MKILGTSNKLGLLVGLHREYDGQKMLGIQTFTLVTLFGSVMFFLVKELD